MSQHEEAYAVADTGELQWFQLKPPLKKVRTPPIYLRFV